MTKGWKETFRKEIKLCALGEFLLWENELSKSSRFLLLPTATPPHPSLLTPARAVFQFFILTVPLRRREEFL